MAVTYDKIATTTLSSTASDVTFSSITSSYTDLILIINASSTANAALFAQFNGDTGSNYNGNQMMGDSGVINSSRSNNNTIMQFGDMTSNRGTIIIHIINYANTTNHKMSLSRNSDATDRTTIHLRQWRNTSAITSVKLIANGTTFTSGSTFNLYGILKA